MVLASACAPARGAGAGGRLLPRARPHCLAGGPRPMLFTSTRKAYSEKGAQATDAIAGGWPRVHLLEGASAPGWAVLMPRDTGSEFPESHVVSARRGQ